MSPTLGAIGWHLRAPHAALVQMLLLLVLASTASAQDVACETSSFARNNRDGSTMLVSTQCVADEPVFRVQYAATEYSSRFVTLAELARDGEFGEPYRSVQLVDLDEDGQWEVEARGMCGAGPNCLGEIYRVNAGKSGLELWFSGGYSELSVRDEHLIESGRASCCSWEYHAWKLGAHAPPLVYDNMDYMITIGGDPSREDQDAPALCTFSRRSGDNWQVIDPPFPAWRELCEVYGESYHLVTPEEAQAAEAATQEQHDG